ncbi:GM22043 [Drosophila sechellia]|uniref:GM22043 n=1 Tax=Drosophila sechellia TaxID=7238 RepID=B4HQP4_DROSE|nr:GM22043 [Drosophila sechellia]
MCKVLGTKKIVQLNTLTSDHERKPVVEEVMAQQQQDQEQQEPLKGKLTLPVLPENNAEETEVLPATNKVGEADAAGTSPAGESLTSVKKTMAPSETIIDKPSTGMQQLVSPTTAENAGDTGTKTQSGVQRKKDEQKAGPPRPRPKTKRKQKPTGAPTFNETDIKMTANRVVTAPVPGPVRPETNPIVGPGSGPLYAKQPAKELETQSLSPEISTHRPLTTKSRGKGKGKGKGKDKRRQGSQRRPAIAGVMEEEIETTTNWWQILPYAEIRKFLNTIYDTIADDDGDERATVDV